MERRDFLKKVGTTTTAAGALTALPAAVASAATGDEIPSPQTESRKALHELISSLEEIDRVFLAPSNGRIMRPEDVSEGHRFMMHTLYSSLMQYIEMEPSSPRFHRIISPNVKLLGDQPDAVYFTAGISADYTYKVRGNVAGATYTSITIESGTADGSYPTQTSGAINDTEFEVKPDGSYELVLSAEEQPGDWLKLVPDASRITTRHYYEQKESVAADPNKHVPISIEVVGGAPPPPLARDAKIADRIRNINRCMRGLTIEHPIADASSPQPPWVSKIPNTFNPPGKPGKMAFAAVDNAYASAPFVIGPDQALLVRGRFPKCRFSNLVLWNRYLQSFDYANRQISRNRANTTLEEDGSFKMVIAHKDPGIPNWLDTEGRPFGMMYWRFLLPEGPIEPLKTEVVPFDSLKSA